VSLVYLFAAAGTAFVVALALMKRRRVK
jgi:hypothetical protein